MRGNGTTYVTTLLKGVRTIKTSRSLALRSLHPHVDALAQCLSRRSWYEGARKLQIPQTARPRLQTACADLKPSSCTAPNVLRQLKKYDTTCSDVSAHRIAHLRLLHTQTLLRTQPAKPPIKDGVEESGRSFHRKTESIPRHNPNQPLSQRLPHISHIHRPTREELLAAASGFWSRLKVRFKWFSIRSLRPFNADEIGAFFSWVLLGHVLWIILGTTTFFSLAILAVNTVFAQETLARWVGNYLTKSSGLKVVFESAIVPRWGDGVITFKNVFVSRRPGHGRGNVTKGSPTEEAAAAAAAASSVEVAAPSVSGGGAQDTNFTQFDLSLDTVNVTLSFRKWFNSKGLLEDVEVKGVRGVIDRTSVNLGSEDIDPRSYKHEHNPGDFEIGLFRLEDLLVTVHQPGNFRPFPVSIYNCELPQLRRQWLFYDFLSANVMSGSIDDSLFTIHPVQTKSFLSDVSGHADDDPDGPHSWKRQSRLRIAGLNIDHLNRGVQGPFSWIHKGNVDVVADMKLPEELDASLIKLMSDFYGRLEATVTAPGARAEVTTADGSRGKDLPIVIHAAEDERFLVLDLKLHLNDIRAAVPIFTKELSYVNNALVRPIVAYMNTRRTFIPINCRVVKNISEFDGSWTIFDSGLMDDLSKETYAAFARDVSSDQAKLRRFRKVGFWSLQLAAQAFFMGLAGSLA